MEREETKEMSYKFILSFQISPSPLFYMAFLCVSVLRDISFLFVLFVPLPLPLCLCLRVRLSLKQNFPTSSSPAQHSVWRLSLTPRHVSSM